MHIKRTLDVETKQCFAWMWDVRTVLFSEPVLLLLQTTVLHYTQSSQVKSLQEIPVTYSVHYKNIFIGSQHFLFVKVPWGTQQGTG